MMMMMMSVDKFLELSPNGARQTSLGKSGRHVLSRFMLSNTGTVPKINSGHHMHSEFSRSFNVGTASS
jgi:hypothetical protein